MSVAGLSDLIFFFFKQKTAYEMRISDWSSDVCSSDLTAVAVRVTPVGQVAGRQQQIGPVGTVIQGAQDLVQPLAVEFGGVVRVEAQMDVRDLRDQHWS